MNAAPTISQHCGSACGAINASERDAIDVKVVDKLVARLGRRRQDLIPLLQAIQKEYRWLPPGALERLCQITDITPDAVTSAATFYSQFRLRPVGKQIVKVCVGTACHVKGAGVVADGFHTRLKISAGDDMSMDGEYTVEKVACLGCCALAPVVQVEAVTYGHVEARSVPDLLRDSKSLVRPASEESFHQHGENAAGEVRICLCSSCAASGSREVWRELKRQIKAWSAPVSIREVGCPGNSFEAPLIEIALSDGRRLRYGCVNAEDVGEILTRHFRPANWMRRARLRASHVLETIFTDEVWQAPTRYMADGRCFGQPFTAKQTRIVTEHAGELRPLNLNDYLGREGFRALETCLRNKTPEEVIGDVHDSGLRGRGGAGFPTGQKWRVTRAAPGSEKYVICNGDEGDPGAFMDRMVLESFPFRVIEGMAIAAYAIGAREGFLYIRAEYPLATERIRAAIAICENTGYLGTNILGSGQDLKLKVVEGAGAFVCGEETALISAIEGGRGMPRFRPPFPAESGLWGKPTLINNVETLASIPWIIRNGPERFAMMGSGKSKGAKTFALAGKVLRGGLIEAPMGMTIHEIVHEIGGGIPNGRKLKAVLMGGPSGGCVPASLVQTPVDYEELRAVGAIMGSGGMVVLDDTDCMVDIARYFMSFCQDESCGKCTHCRVGTMRMKEILTRLCDGKGRKGDLEKLEALAAMTVQGSLCGLGKTAPNPVLSCLRYFRDEFEAHLRGECPAKKCAAMIRYRVTDACFGCTRCAQHCPSDAIPMNPYRHHVIQEPLCIRCDICRSVCPVDAIEIVNREIREIREKGEKGEKGEDGWGMIVWRWMIGWRIWRVWRWVIGWRI